MGARRITATAIKTDTVNACVRGHNSRPGRFLGDEEGDDLYQIGEGSGRAARPLLGREWVMQYLHKVFNCL
jgi:hypothetical protein